MVKKIGSTGRFGARYGRKIRTKVLMIEKGQKKKQKCPYCSEERAKRMAVGIFKCRKCDSKFTGNAYVVN